MLDGLEPPRDLGGWVLGQLLALGAADVGGGEERLADERGAVRVLGRVDTGGGVVLGPALVDEAAVENEAAAGVRYCQ